METESDNFKPGLDSVGVEAFRGENCGTGGDICICVYYNSVDNGGNLAEKT